MPHHVAVIDPGTKHGELDAFNQLSLRYPLAFSYHQIINQGLASLDHAARTAPIKAIVVFGSGATVGDEEPWQAPLQERLLTYLDQGIPMLAICYGLQLLGRALGGTLDYVTPERTKLKGLRKITITSHPRLACNNDQAGEVIVSHNQCLRVPPPEATVLSHNADYDFVEVFAHDRLPLVAIQAHPEAGQQFVTGNEVPLDPADPANYAFGGTFIDGFFRSHFPQMEI